MVSISMGNIGLNEENSEEFIFFNSKYDSNEDFEHSYLEENAELELDIDDPNSEIDGYPEIEYCKSFSFYPYPKYKVPLPEIDLSDKTDEELVDEVKSSGCNDSFLELSRRHSAIYFKVYSKYSSAISATGDSSDILNDKDYALYKAILSYESEKGAKFITWFWNTVRYKCLSYVNKRIREVSLYSISEEEKDDLSKSIVERDCFEFNEAEKRKSTESFSKYLTNEIDKMEDSRIKQIFEARYFSGRKNKGWKKVGQDVGLCGKTCASLHNKTIRALRNKIKHANI